MKRLFWLLFSLGILAAAPAFAQQTAPAQVNGCIYNSSAPTLTTKQSVVFQCDQHGNLLTTLSAGTAVIGHVITDTGSVTILQAGSAIAGKFGIDQTTPGTTNGVQVNAALPAGTNSIGQVAGYEAHIAITPTVTAGAYASGNCIGGFNAITVAQSNGQGLFVTNFRVTSLGGSTPTLTIYIFDANPSSSTCTDKSTFTLNSADVDKLVASPFAITLSAPTGTTLTFGNLANMGRPFLAGGSAASGVKTIYVGMVTGTIFTPGSTSDLHEDVGVAG